jgi:hypothetical protein
VWEQVLFGIHPNGASGWDPEGHDTRPGGFWMGHFIADSPTSLPQRRLGPAGYIAGLIPRAPRGPVAWIEPLVRRTSPLVRCG